MAGSCCAFISQWIFEFTPNYNCSSCGSTSLKLLHSCKVQLLTSILMKPIYVELIYLSAVVDVFACSQLRSSLVFPSNIHFYPHHYRVHGEFMTKPIYPPPPLLSPFVWSLHLPQPFSITLRFFSSLFCTIFFCYYGLQAYTLSLPSFLFAGNPSLSSSPSFSSSFFI